MTVTTKKLLLDVREAGESILQHTAKRTLAGYAADRFFRRAVEREFEIIGEALSRLDRIDPATAGQIAERRRIVDFRNRIIHGYDTIDDVVQTARIRRLFLESPPGPPATFCCICNKRLSGGP